MKLSYAMKTDAGRVRLSNEDSCYASGQNGIFVVDSAGIHARYYPVRLGIVADEKTEILSPSLEGVVVTLGQHLLEDGSPIILPRANAHE